MEIKTENIVIAAGIGLAIYFLTKKKETTAVVAGKVIDISVPPVPVGQVITPITVVPTTGGVSLNPIPNTTVAPTTGGVMPPNCKQYKFIKDMQVQASQPECFAAPCPPTAAMKNYKAGDVICGVYMPPIIQTNPLIGAPNFGGSLSWSDGGGNYVIYGDDAVQMAGDNRNALASFTGRDFYSFAGDFFNVKANWN